jgi:NAD(P)H-flavin reductase/hemoglobin-like flavoprotein
MRLAGMPLAGYGPSAAGYGGKRAMTLRHDSLRPESPAPEALPRPEAAAVPDAVIDGGQRRSLAWWRLRSWKKDLELLARLRDGLRALPDDPETDADDPADGGAPAAEAGAPDSSRGRHRAPIPGPPGPEPEPEPDLAGRAQVGGISPASQPADAPAAAAATAAGPAGAADEGSGGVQPDQAMAAIRATFASLADAGDEAASYFYGWLFSRRPDLRELFPPAMDEQRDRLLRALTRIVDTMSTPEEMASYLGQLGRDHRKYDVQPWMYEAVGAALNATLRAYAGAAFTAEAEEAWTQIYTAASSIMIRSAEDDSARNPSSWPAEVVACEERGPGIAVLTIAPDQELPFQAGQHITLQTSRWPHVWRPYSIAGCPRDDGLIRIHVKAVPGGWVSNTLVFHSEPGDEVILGPALGTMTLDAAQGRDLLCVAGGTGLSPIKAITEQVIKDSGYGSRRRVYLYYGARRREELYDLRDLWRLVDAYEGLQLTLVTSDDPAYHGMQGNVGRVAARYLPHDDCEAYVAGPPGMVRETLRVLGRAGIPADRMHYDDALLGSGKRIGTGT